VLRLSLEYKAVFCFLKLSKLHSLLICGQNSEKLIQKHLYLVLELFRSDMQSENLLGLYIHFPHYQIHNYQHHEEGFGLSFSIYVIKDPANKLNQILKFPSFRIQLSILHNILKYLEVSEEIIFQGFLYFGKSSCFKKPTILFNSQTAILIYFVFR
jgi:hypothetical protein